jgi:mono/diheme cytochrome c family protein
MALAICFMMMRRGSSVSSSDRIKVMNRKIRKNVSSCGAIAIAIYLGSIGIAIGQDAPRSTSTGVFSEEQVKKGSAAYNANCASCHGSDLISTDREFPSLTGGSFKFAWVGKTIGEKFDFIRNAMPPKEERSLDDQVYLDIVTYILRFNKVPAGDQTLKPDLEILNHLVIAAPPT